jgi:gliding motility-associated-like protein
MIKFSLKIIVVFLLLSVIKYDSYSQVLINNGTYTHAYGGSYIKVNGSFENNNLGDFTIDEQAGVPAELFVSEDITNNANLTADGNIRLIGNWYNNSTFTSNLGTVFFEGANQILGGSVSSVFYKLTLDGAGLKTQAIDQYATGILDLKHLELQTETYGFYMQNTAINSIIRTTGFVSSLDGGFLSRNTNITNAYLFPVGSSDGVLRYRPVELTPNNASATTYTVRMANLDASIEGYDVSLLSPDLCQVNPLFYHQINRTFGNTSADIDIYYDEAADGEWDGIANWHTPLVYWEDVTGSSTTAGAPLSVASKSNWDDFSEEAYALSRVNIAPVFIQLGPYCEGDVPDVLPGSSINGISGTWSPSVINTNITGDTDYVFTPSFGECGYTYTMTITVNPVPIVDLGSDVAVCEDATPITLDAGAGMSSYLWSTLEITQSINVINTGTYSVVVSNTYGCTAQDEIDITVNPLPAVSFSGLDAQYCYEDASVLLSGNPMGGSFSGNGISGSQFTPADAGIGPHDITYTYTDANGCSNTSTISTEVTPMPEVIVSDVTQASCFGVDDGSITVTASSGSGGYIYDWDNSSSTGPTASGLSPGEYNVTIYDSNGCTATTSATIVYPEEIIVDIDIIQEVSCFSYSDAILYANVSGGTSPYNFLWNDTGNSTTQQISNLPAGNYTVNVTDANGCQANANITLTQPPILDVGFINISDVSCFGYSDGSATALPVGGSSPYEYSWNDPSNSLSPSIVNVPANNYTVVVTDANGCTVSNTITIDEPEELELTGSTVPVTCGSSLGSAQVNVTGGTLPYNYVWSSLHTGNIATGLVSDTYTVSVVDGNGCSDELTLYVGITGSGLVEITETNSIQCYGDSNASLTGTMTNGVGPYEYLWSNESTNQTITNLPAGIYSLQITDSWGCSGSNSYMVSQPDPIDLSFTTTDVTCFGYEDGSATVIASGGTPGYSYEWVTGETSSVLSDVGAVSYQVMVTDSRFCEMIGQVVVSGPESPVIINMVVENISCNGYNDGAVTLNVEGGTPPYNYNWQLGDYTSNESNINNLFEGVYNLTVTDNNNCVQETEATIAQPSELDADFIKMNPSCIGNNDGYIEIIAQGGTSPYNYEWSEGSSSIEFIDGLVEGEYLVTVIDANGCEYELDIIQLTDVQEECLRIPNAFSPNGDGTNDTWIIENIHLYPRTYIKVFNRWGQALYEANGTEDPWDGTYNGNPVPAGVYLYIIDLFTADEPKTGTVTVVR